MFYKGKHMLSIGDFSREDFLKVFAEAQRMETAMLNFSKRAALRHILHKPHCDPFSPQLCEPMEFHCLFDGSTRTDFTFSQAIKNLGGVSTSKSVQASSVSKGESARMTALVFAPFLDGIVVRNDAEPFFAKDMAEAADEYGYEMSVFNGGCGNREHPSQTLIDCYSFYRLRKQEFLGGKLTFAIFGDLSHSRTIHSFLRGLANFYSDFKANAFGPDEKKKIKIFLLAPESEELPGWLIQELAGSNLEFERVKNPLDIAHTADGFYFTRWQGNLRKASEAAKKKEEMSYARKFGANIKLRDAMHKHAIVVHPLPHGFEYPGRIDLIDPRFVHIKQMNWGVFIRMAILRLRFAPAEAMVRVKKEHFIAVSPINMVNVQIPVNEVIGQCDTRGCNNVIISGYGRTVELATGEKEKLKKTPSGTFCSKCGYEVSLASISE